MTEFTHYQATRRFIPECRTLDSFLQYANGLEHNLYKGIIREWRAYWYLVKRFPGWDIFISKTKDDVAGVDIQMNKIVGDRELLVQVGMIKPDKKNIQLRVHRYCQVPDDPNKPIYFINVEK